MSQYQLAGMPTSYAFDRSGELVSTHVGFRKKDAERIEQNLAQLIEHEQNLEKPR